MVARRLDVSAGTYIYNKNKDRQTIIKNHTQAERFHTGARSSSAEQAKSRSKYK